MNVLSNHSRLVRVYSCSYIVPLRKACGKAQAIPKVPVITKTPTAPPSPASTQNFCINHVKKFDRENYLAAICISNPTLRRIVFALRAFNVELAIVKDFTTGEDRAKIRFHFWSKLVEEIVRQNDQPKRDIDKSIAYYKHTPVAKELLDLFYLVDVDKDIQRHLTDLIGARLSSKSLGKKLFDSIDELELYCDKSNSSIYHLCWKLAQQIETLWHSDYDVIPIVGSISESLGRAHGLANIIRGIHYNAFYETCYIPVDMMQSHQLRTVDFVGRQLNGDKIAPLVQSLANRCQERLNEVHRDQSKIPQHFRHLFLPRLTIQAALNRLKKRKYNVCDPLLKRRDNLLPLKLWMGSKFHRVPLL